MIKKTEINKERKKKERETCLTLRRKKEMYDIKRKEANKCIEITRKI